LYLRGEPDFSKRRIVMPKKRTQKAFQRGGAGGKQKKGKSTSVGEIDMFYGKLDERLERSRQTPRKGGLEKGEVGPSKWADSKNQWTALRKTSRRGR